MKKAIYWLTLLVGWALLPLAIIWAALKIVVAYVDHTITTNGE